MGPLIYISSPTRMPLAYALQLFQTAHGGEPGLLMAASTMMMLPVPAAAFLLHSAVLYPGRYADGHQGNSHRNGRLRARRAIRHNMPRNRKLNIPRIKGVVMCVLGFFAAIGSAVTGIGAQVAAAPMINFLLGFTPERTGGTGADLRVLRDSLGYIERQMGRNSHRHRPCAPHRIRRHGWRRVRCAICCGSAYASGSQDRSDSCDHSGCLCYGQRLPDPSGARCRRFRSASSISIRY